MPNVIVGNTFYHLQKWKMGIPMRVLTLRNFLLDITITINFQDEKFMMDHASWCHCIITCTLYSLLRDKVPSNYSIQVTRGI